MDSDRYTSAIVLHTHAVVGMNGYGDVFTVSSHCLIDTVINHFINQVVQPGNIHVSNVHGRS